MNLIQKIKMRKYGMKNKYKIGEVVCTILKRHHDLWSAHEFMVVKMCFHKDPNKNDYRTEGCMSKVVVTSGADACFYTGTDSACTGSRGGSDSLELIHGIQCYDKPSVIYYDIEGRGFHEICVFKSREEALKTFIHTERARNQAGLRKESERHLEEVEQERKNHKEKIKLFIRNLDELEEEEGKIN